MATVEVVRALSPTDRAAIDGFLSRLTNQLGHHGAAADRECERLDDHLLLDFRHGPRPGFVAATAVVDDSMVGYAQASASARGHVVDSIVDPSADPGLKAELLGAILAELPTGGHVTWWAHDDDSDAAAALGLTDGRRLLQMRVDLPLDHPIPHVHTRAFRVGVDEAEWLEVNNAAFDWHDEQGGWDLETVRQREREPWFDPDGFLVLDVDGVMAGFCWTKLHQATDGSAPIGEIYVIAVHPRHKGTGLGRALTLAGIGHLTAAGARACMLFVDADNAPAVALYNALGFRTVHAEQAFTRSAPTDGGTR